MLINVIFTDIAANNFSTQLQNNKQEVAAGNMDTNNHNSTKLINFISCETLHLEKGARQ